MRVSEGKSRAAGGKSEAERVARNTLRSLGFIALRNSARSESAISRNAFCCSLRGSWFRASSACGAGARERNWTLAAELSCENLRAWASGGRKERNSLCWAGGSAEKNGST